MSVNIGDFKQEVECVYKDERYSVRDNGAILRHCREGKRPRPTDNQWIFGKPNEKTGYMEIAAVRVHRIVAMAFHGEPPTKEHVVDHIDTNKRNNRPENLRWVTRLENILLNPITAKRIELICGSVEAFLADPSKFRDKFPEPNYQWMCTVSKEEGQASLERLTTWAKSDKHLSGGSLGEWLFNRTTKTIQEKPAIIMSLTPRAAQRLIFPNDKPHEYPCTPQEVGSEPLVTYANNLKKGDACFRNHNGAYLVVKSGFSKDCQSLYIMSEAGYVWEQQENGEYITVPRNISSPSDNYDNLPAALTKITYENDLFVHSRIGTGFQPKEELEKIFINCTQGLK
jgi:hypothetical protein